MVINFGLGFDAGYAGEKHEKAPDGVSNKESWWEGYCSGRASKAEDEGELIALQDAAWDKLKKAD